MMGPEATADNAQCLSEECDRIFVHMANAVLVSNVEGVKTLCFGGVTAMLNPRKYQSGRTEDLK